MDFAVADFNEDGNADFVLSVDLSTYCGLYLGDGAFGFEYITLPGNKPSSTTGADAADFNNDGHADFVIAPGHDDPFYVRLGHGDGTFTPSDFESVDGLSVSGVAAADFTGDGITDIAAVYLNKLHIYQGAIIDNPEGIDGVTFTYMVTPEQESLPINAAGLDNLDFDGDGNQDLVVADYGAFPFPVGMAVLLNNGDGTFSHFATYPSVSGTEFNAVAAQPWKPEPVPNVAPVAVIAPDYIESTVGEEIVFDGSNSIDEDGQIVSYEWDFGYPAPSADAGVSAMMTTAGTEEAGPEATGINPSYTYGESGEYVVTLTVTDDKGSTSSVQAQVVVLAKPEPQPLPEPEPEPNLIQAKVKFSPHKLNFGKKRGKGHQARHLKAKIEFGEGFDARNVILSEVYVTADNESKIFARARPQRGFMDKLANSHRRPKRSISVKFDRQAVLDAIGCPAAKETTLTVGGLISQNGVDKAFEATGMIRLKMKKGGQCSAD